MSFNQWKEYSRLIYLHCKIKSSELEKISKNLIESWKKGTKIILISNDKVILKKINENLDKSLDYLSNYDDFKKDKFNFLFIEYVGKVNINNFEIINGNIEDKIDLLEEIDLNSTFNLNQYKVEHCITGENIEIKAGAGSGKTYSMVSRIAYLIFKHRYNHEDVTNKICLITFTNDAAKNMKERLRIYFLNMYLLTQSYNFFELIDNIELMKISTIHSLSKKVVDKFSHLIELGVDSKITQNNFERDEIIKKLLEEYSKKEFKDLDLYDALGYKVFNLIKIISGVLEKLEQKNILLEDGYNFGDNNEAMNKLFNSVIPDLQKKIIESSIEKNEIRLSELIIMIKKILDSDNLKVMEQIKVDYLFIDEFQDTDNT